MFRQFALELCLQHDVLNVIIAGLGDAHNCAQRFRIEHDFMLDQRVLLHKTEYVAACHVWAHAYITIGLKLPLGATI